MVVNVYPINPDEFDDLIEFDKLHLLGVMKKIGIEERKCAPLLSHAELLTAYQRKDILLWLFVDNHLAGYMWREKQPNCLFGAGAAIKREFYGLGLSHYIINLTEQLAREAGLKICQLAVIPENGRVVSAYMRHGYRITRCVLAYAGAKYPDTFRCIMEKNLEEVDVENEILDRCEVFCVDEKKLKILTDNGYVGARFIRANSDNLVEHKIVLEKYY